MKYPISLRCLLHCEVLEVEMVDVGVRGCNCSRHYDSNSVGNYASDSVEAAVMNDCQRLRVLLDFHSHHIRLQKKYEYEYSSGSVRLTLEPRIKRTFSRRNWRPSLVGRCSWTWTIIPTSIVTTSFVRSVGWTFDRFPIRSGYIGRFVTFFAFNDIELYDFSVAYAANCFPRIVLNNRSLKSNGMMNKRNLFQPWERKFDTDLHSCGNITSRTWWTNTSSFVSFLKNKYEIIMSCSEHRARLLEDF